MEKTIRAPKKKKADEPIIINPPMKKPTTSGNDVNESFVAAFSKTCLSENSRSASIASAIIKAAVDPDAFIASFRAIQDAYK